MAIRLSKLPTEPYWIGPDSAGCRYKVRPINVLTLQLFGAKVRRMVREVQEGGPMLDLLAALVPAPEDLAETSGEDYGEALTRLLQAIMLGQAHVMDWEGGPVDEADAPVPYSGDALRLWFSTVPLVCDDFLSLFMATHLALAQAGNA